MGRPPAFPLYAADFYMDTLTWDTDDIGVYFCLLMAEWVNGPLEKDTKKLAKIAKKTHQKFIKNFSKISQKFVVICTENGEFLVNNRLEEEREKQRYYKELQRVKGIKSGKSRFNHGLTTVEPTPQPKGNLSFSSSISSSIKPKNKKESIKKKESHAHIFIKPSLEEIEAYCQERKNNVNPKKWLDHYTANGWKIGKALAPMKDWQAAVRTWEGNNYDSGGNNGTGNSKQPEAYPAPAYNEDDDPFAEEMAAYKRGELK